MQLALTF